MNVTTAIRIPRASTLAASLLGCAILAACPNPQARHPRPHTARPGAGPDSSRPGPDSSRPGPRPGHVLGPAVSGPLTWKVSAFSVGPVQVLHKATPGRPVVAIRIYFDGGVRHLDDRTAGLEELTLSTLELGGSRKYPRVKLARVLALRGIQLYSAAGRDYSVLAAKATVGEFARAWDILTDILAHPNFDETAFQVQRRRQLSMALTQQDEPDDAVFLNLDRWYYEGHPYARRQTGTPGNLQHFTLQDVRKYYEQVLSRAPLLVVVSGGVDLDTVRRAAEATLSGLPKPLPPKPLPPQPARRGFRVRSLARDMPTTYVLGYFPAPRPGAPDWAAAELAARWLSAELFEELRTKLRLCYAVTVGLSSRRQNVGYVYMATRQPEVALRKALAVRQRLLARGLDEATLQGLRSVAVTRALMGIETQSGQAKYLARAALVAGSWRWALRAPAALAQVQAEEVLAALRKYMSHIWFVTLGPQPVGTEAILDQGSDQTGGEPAPGGTPEGPDR